MQFRGIQNPPGRFQVRCAAVLSQTGVRRDDAPVLAGCGSREHGSQGQNVSQPGCRWPYRTHAWHLIFVPYPHSGIVEVYVLLALRAVPNRPQGILILALQCPTAEYFCSATVPTRIPPYVEPLFGTLAVPNRRISLESLTPHYACKLCKRLYSPCNPVGLVTFFEEPNIVLLPP